MTAAEALGAVVTPSPAGCVLALTVSPRAAKTAFSGIAADRLKLRVAAPPAEGAANEAVIRFLAAVLDVPMSRVRLVAGQRGRRKQIAITGLSVGEAIARLAPALAAERRAPGEPFSAAR